MPNAIALPEETVTISRVDYERYQQLEGELADVKAQLAELQRLIFGRKSERYIPSENGQMSLFDGQKDEEGPVEAPVVQQVSYEREAKPKEKQKPVRALLPSHLPRQEEL